MGQFSWITQDTNEAIRESYECSDKKKTSAFMHDNKGNVWEEDDYEGYGVFAGMDFYSLLARMNDISDDRYDGIILSCSDKPYISPNLTRHRDWKWINEAPDNDPNQGWGDDEDQEED